MNMHRCKCKTLLFFLMAFFFAFAVFPIAYALTPPGLEEAQPCVDSNLLPTQARVPCNGIAIFSEGLTKQDRANLIKSTGAELKTNFTLFNAASIFVPNEDAWYQLLNESKIEKIIPDQRIFAFAKPSNPGGKPSDNNSSSQIIPSGITRIGAPPGKLSEDGSGIGIAIVDTGLDLSNADLNIGNLCFDSAWGTCVDGNGHGTHVAGIVAAINNDRDVVGVAPGSSVYAVKVLNDSGSGYDSDIIQGLEWVALNATQVTPTIKVVNISLGRDGTLDDNPILRSAVQILHDMNITVVVAAGNDQNAEVSEKVPATYPEVIAVASTSAQDGSNSCRSYKGYIHADTASFYTTDGAYDESLGIGVSISAPGESKENISKGCFIQSIGIDSLKVGGGIVALSGTSMSSPHVAGVVVLLLEQNSTRTPEIIRSILRASTDRAGVAPLNSPARGYTFDGIREGILSACQALGEPCP